MLLTILPDMRRAEAGDHRMDDPFQVGLERFPARAGRGPAADGGGGRAENGERDRSRAERRIRSAEARGEVGLDGVRVSERTGEPRGAEFVVDAHHLPLGEHEGCAGGAEAARRLPEGTFDTLERIDAGGERREGRFEYGAARIELDPEQFALRAEVVEEGVAAHTGPLGDLLDRGLRVALLEEELGCGLLQHLLGGGSGATGAGHRAILSCTAWWRAHFLPSSLGWE
ncbi:hypothetical protein BH09PAT4_BH09PAT4_09050 [soil metagenome]